MEKKTHSTTIQIPSGINFEVDKNTVIIKGSKGELKRSFLNPRIIISKVNNLVSIKCEENIKFSQSDKMYINTYRAHIINMFNGVSNGYSAKLKICAGHFPMNVSVDGTNFVIKNFLGEKVPRKISILNSVKVQVQGDEILVNGIDKEAVGQTAAKIEQLTRITNKDRRIFQDGCYIIQKPGD